MIRDATAPAGPRSPVALFAFRRPDHLSATVRSLAANALAAQTDLHVFCDGPRDDRDRQATEETRAMARTIEGFRSVRVVESPVNLGLSRSIVGGIDELLGIHESVVVLEDDMVVSPDFLAYMNEGVRRYASHPQVASIHGYCYPVADKNLPESFFLRGADCWGWATWRKAWQVFESDGTKLLRQLQERNLGWALDFEGTYPYVRMLQDQVAGRNDSWAIRWYASAFLADMVTLYPRASLVENIGLDGSGTHCGLDPSLQAARTLGGIPGSWPEIVRENPLGRKAFRRHFRRQAGIGPWKGSALELLGRLGWQA